MSETVKKATRDGFGDEIVELGRENSSILVVDVDIGKSCKTGAFRKALPEQYLNVGNAEQNAAAWPRASPPAERSPSWSPMPPSAPCGCAR